MDDRPSSLARPVVLTFLRQGGAGLMQLANIVVLARFAGPENVGLFALGTFLAQFVSLLLGLGFGPALVYFSARGDVDVLAARKLSLLLSVGIGLVGGVVFALATPLVATIIPELPYIFFYTAVGFFPYLLFNSYLLAILQGKRDFNAYNLGLLLAPGLTLLFTIIVTVTYGISAFPAFAIWGLSHVACTAFLFIAVGRLAERGQVSRFRFSLVADMWGYGWKAHISNSVSFMIYRTDIVLLNYFFGPALAGLYTAAIQIAEKLWMFSTAVATVVLPRLAGLRDEFSGSDGRRTVCASFQVVGILSMIVTIPLLIFASFVVNVLYGANYLSVAVPLQILLVGSAVFGAGRTLASSVSAAGRPDLTMRVALGALVVNLIGNIALIPEFGMIGAALATATTYILATTANLLLVRRVYEVTLGELTDVRWMRAVVSRIAGSSAKD